MHVSCIVPFFNEGSRLFHVLRTLTCVRNLSEIICIDDGSDQDISGRIRKYFPEVRTYRMKQNKGKAEAIREGLRHAQHDVILLLDADLRNLNHTELEAAIHAFHSHATIDMLILRRMHAPFLIRLIRGDILVTGERILHRKDLQEILDAGIEGYQIEAAVNEHMFHRNVFWFPHSAINTYKQMKMNVLQGMRDDLSMFADIVAATGFWTMMKHILFFGRKRIPPYLAYAS